MCREVVSASERSAMSGDVASDKNYALMTVLNGLRAFAVASPRRKNVNCARRSGIMKLFVDQNDSSFILVGDGDEKGSIPQ